MADLNAVMVSKKRLGKKGVYGQRLCGRGGTYKTWYCMPENIPNHAVCAFEGRSRGDDDSRLVFRDVPLNNIKENPATVSHVVCDKMVFGYNDMATKLNFVMPNTRLL